MMLSQEMQTVQMEQSSKPLASKHCFCSHLLQTVELFGSAWFAGRQALLTGGISDLHVTRKTDLSAAVLAPLPAAGKSVGIVAQSSTATGLRMVLTVASRPAQ